METWASAEMEYPAAHQTPQALTYFRETFLELQKRVEPSKDISIVFPDTHATIMQLSEEDKSYYDAVELTTSKGWQWHETYNENLLTGERKTTGGTKPFHLSLGTWEWGGKAMGSSVGFSHFQRDGESKAELLMRILETSEKAKYDFPDSIPYTNIYGQIMKDDFKTRIIFGS